MPRSVPALLLVWLIFAQCLPAHATAPWEAVPPADFSRIKPADFADHELAVPRHLFHFARVANAVVEHGEHRGFLDLAVNRDPADNRPHNARIMEMQMVLAYFYAADRPWNPYRGHPAVRARLEAMLTRWARMQRADGLFAEYSPDNYSLAPTNFGAMTAAQALEILHAGRAPIDREVLDDAEAALRRALMAIFTREDMKRHGRDWSNQYSGSYYAALAFLSWRPDRELERAFAAAFLEALDRDQSPAGFHYEQGGPDFGYSGVHDNNLRVAWPLLRSRAALARPLLEAEARWNAWLAANFAPQPGLGEHPVYLVNAGINTRTSHAVQTPRSRPLAELVPETRPFATTPEEHRRELAARRAALEREWGRWGELRVPNAYAYQPGFVYDAWRPLNTWQVAETDRAAAIARLPALAGSRQNRQLHDAWPVTVTTARRPGYYAAFNSGRIRVPRQVYGLGLLWNENYGTALQAVAGTQWVVGTRAGPMGKTREQSDFSPAFRVGATRFTPRPGVTDLRAGDLQVTYSLEREGRKTVIFADARVETEVELSGPFEEVIPLVVPDDARVEQSLGGLEVRRANGTVFFVETISRGAVIELGPPTPLQEGLSRRLLTLRTRDQLRYALGFR